MSTDSYGSGKTRTMVRSVLPSTRRKSARADRARIHRSARRGDRQSYNSFAGDWDDFAGSLGQRLARGEWSRTTEEAAIRSVMWTRREGDKLGAIMRWGPTKVADVRRMDRLSKLRTLFPQNLVGRHAITHLRYHDEIEVPDGRYIYGAISRTSLSEREAKCKAEVAAEKEMMATKLTEMIGIGGHGLFNSMLKRSWEIPVEPRGRWIGRRFYPYPGQPKVKEYRPLYGLHDVEAFVDYIHQAYAWELVNKLLS